MEVDLVLPRGVRSTIHLGVDDAINFSNPGDPDPVVTVERIGRKHIRVIIRSDDERWNAADLKWLTEARGVEV